MNAKNLKDSILQHAVEGKLIPQNPSEEDAATLLEKIKKDKKQLAQDKVIKIDPKIQSITKDEVPYEIPKSWEWVKLDDICYKINDGTHHTPTYTTKGVPFLSVKDMSKRKLDFSNTKFISEEEHNKLFQRCNPEFGDVLITKVGTTGVPVLVDTHKPFSLFVSVALLKFNKNLVSNKYLFYLIDSPLVSAYSKNHTRGVANKNLVIRAIKNFIIPLPPLEEQIRIVKKIEKLLNKVDQYDRLEQKLTKLNDHFPDNMEKSILQYAVEGKLLPQNTNDEPANVLLKRIKEQKERLIKDKIIRREKSLPPISKDETPFEVPTSWEWVRLKEIYYNLGNKKPDSKFYYIDVASIDNKKGSISESINIINPEEAPSRARKIVRKGTVLYSTIRPYLQNISIVDKDFDLDAIASTAFLVMEPIEISKKYLYYVLKSPFFNTYVKNKMFGVAYPAINDKNLNSAIIPIPPLEEQQRIVEKIEHLLQYIKRIDSTFI